MPTSAAISTTRSAWLDAIIAELEKAWNVRVTDVLDGGSRAFVGAACGADGTQYALKIDLPDNDESEFLRGIRVLQAADGRGYCRPYAFDADRRACLLEKLGPPMKRCGLRVQRQMELLCDAVAQSWAMPIDPAGLPDGNDSIAWFRNFLREAWQSLMQPCSERVLHQAMAYLDSREKNMKLEGFVPLHGDAHNNNMLQSPLNPDQFKLIDPEGLFYEKAYDLGVIMREWPDEYAQNPRQSGRSRSELLSHLTHVDAQAIWEWGFLQMFSTSFVLLQIGHHSLARQMLDIAEAWCD